MSSISIGSGNILTGNNLVWYNTSSTTISGNYYLDPSLGGVTYFPITNIGVTQGLALAKKLAEDVRKWSEEFCEKSPNFDVSMQGFCGLASRKLFKELSKHNIPSKLAYVNTSYFQHIFLILEKNSLFDIGEDYLIDITSHLYTNDPITIKAFSDVDLPNNPWWDYSFAYITENGLISCQRKDKWPSCQITLQAARSKTSKLELVAVGQSNIENGILRIRPFDEGSRRYLQKLSSGKGLKANLAALMLDSDPQVAEAALTIAIEILNR